MRSPAPSSQLRVCMLLHKSVAHDTRVRREAGALAAAGHEVTVVHLPPPAEAEPAGLPFALAPATLRRGRGRLPHAARLGAEATRLALRAAATAPRRDPRPRRGDAAARPARRPAQRREAGLRLARARHRRALPARRLAGGRRPQRGHRRAARRCDDHRLGGDRDAAQPALPAAAPADRDPQPARPAAPRRGRGAGPAP